MYKDGESLFDTKEEQERNQLARAASLEAMPQIDSFSAKSKFNHKAVFVKVFRDFKSKPREIKDCIMK